MNNELVQKIGGRGEKILKDNLVENEEKIAVKLQGSFGEGLVLTNKRLYVLKWGFMAGNTLGGRCNVFEFSNITGIEIKKNLVTGTIEILTPATQNTQKSFWGAGNSNAIKSDNVITFQRNKFKLFQEAVKTIRSFMGQVNSKNKQEESNYADLEKLAQLKEKGIITQEEFNAKKKSILNL